MPKENTAGCDATFRVEVSWAPNAWIQLASVNTESQLTLPPGGGPGSEPFDGWHVTLDRDGVNRLIRSLRKARDAVYGRDE